MASQSDMAAAAASASPAPGRKTPKLLSAEAAHQGVDRERCPQHFGEALQGLIADIMAVGVIDLLEVVRVDHQERAATCGRELITHLTEQVGARQDPVSVSKRT